MLLFNNYDNNINSSNIISLKELVKTTKKLKLPELPLSSKTLLDEIKIYQLTHPQKYNKLFINNQIPLKHDITQDYIINNLSTDTVYIDYNTIEKCIYELKKKGNIYNKLSQKIQENQELLNLCKNKLSLPLNKSQLIQLIKEVQHLNYEKENLEKISLLNKYKYLSTFKTIDDINQEKYVIYDNCNQAKDTLLNKYKLTPEKYKNLTKILKKLDKTIKKQSGGNVNPEVINKELEQLPENLKKAYDYFQLQNNSASELKKLETKLSQMCKNEKNIDKCIDNISERLVSSNEITEKLNALENELNDSTNIINQKNKLIEKLNGDFLLKLEQQKEETNNEIEEIIGNKDFEINSLKEQIEQLNQYKKEFESQSGELIKKDSEMIETKQEMEMLKKQLEMIDLNKNKVMEQLVELSGKYSENETELQLKENEIAYLNKHNTELETTNTKLKESTAEIDKLKKKNKNYEEIINDFEKNLTIIDDNKTKLLAKLTELENINLLYTQQNQFFDSFKNLNFNDFESTKNSLAKLRHKLEQIKGTIKLDKAAYDGPNKEKYSSYESILSQYLSVIEQLTSMSDKIDSEKSENNPSSSSSDPDNNSNSVKQTQVNYFTNKENLKTNIEEYEKQYDEKMNRLHTNFNSAYDAIMDNYRTKYEEIAKKPTDKTSTSSAEGAADSLIINPDEKKKLLESLEKEKDDKIHKLKTQFQHQAKHLVKILQAKYRINPETYQSTSSPHFQMKGGGETLESKNIHSDIEIYDNYIKLKELLETPLSLSLKYPHSNLNTVDDSFEDRGLDSSPFEDTDLNRDTFESFDSNTNKDDYEYLEHPIFYSEPNIRPIFNNLYNEYISNDQNRDKSKIMLDIFKDRILYYKDIDKSFLEDFNSRIVDEIDTLLQQEQSEQVEKGIILYDTGESSDSKFNILNLQFIQGFLNGFTEKNTGDIDITNSDIILDKIDNNIDQILAHYAQFTDSKFYKEICNKLIEIKNNNPTILNKTEYKLNNEEINELTREKNKINNQIDSYKEQIKQKEYTIEENKKSLSTLDLDKFTEDQKLINANKIKKSHEEKLKNEQEELYKYLKSTIGVQINNYKEKPEEIPIDWRNINFKSAPEPYTKYIRKIDYLKKTIEEDAKSIDKIQVQIEKYTKSYNKKTKEINDLNKEKEELINDKIDKLEKQINDIIKNINTHETNKFNNKQIIEQAKHIKECFETIQNKLKEYGIKEHFNKHYISPRKLYELFKNSEDETKNLDIFTGTYLKLYNKPSTEDIQIYLEPINNYDTLNIKISTKDVEAYSHDPKNTYYTYKHFGINDDNQQSIQTKLDNCIKKTQNNKNYFTINSYGDLLRQRIINKDTQSSYDPEIIGLLEKRDNNMINLKELLIDSDYDITKYIKNNIINLIKVIKYDLDFNSSEQFLLDIYEEILEDNLQKIKTIPIKNILINAEKILNNILIIKHIQLDDNLFLTNKFKNDILFNDIDNFKNTILVNYDCNINEFSSASEIKKCIKHFDNEEKRKQNYDKLDDENPHKFNKYSDILFEINNLIHNKYIARHNSKLHLYHMHGGLSFLESKDKIEQTKDTPINSSSNTNIQTQDSDTINYDNIRETIIKYTKEHANNQELIDTLDTIMNCSENEKILHIINETLKKYYIDIENMSETLYPYNSNKKYLGGDINSGETSDKLDKIISEFKQHCSDSVPFSYYINLIINIFNKAIKNFVYNKQKLNHKVRLLGMVQEEEKVQIDISNYFSSLQQYLKILQFKIDTANNISNNTLNNKLFIDEIKKNTHHLYFIIYLFIAASKMVDYGYINKQRSLILEHLKKENEEEEEIKESEEEEEIKESEEEESIGRKEDTEEEKKEQTKKIQQITIYDEKINFKLVLYEGLTKILSNININNSKFKYCVVLQEKIDKFLDEIKGALEAAPPGAAPEAPEPEPETPGTSGAAPGTEAELETVKKDLVETKTKLNNFMQKIRDRIEESHEVAEKLKQCEPEDSNGFYSTFTALDKFLLDKDNDLNTLNNIDNLDKLYELHLDLTTHIHNIFGETHFDKVLSNEIKEQITEDSENIQLEKIKMYFQSPKTFSVKFKSPTELVQILNKLVKDTSSSDDVPEPEASSLKPSAERFSPEVKKPLSDEANQIIQDYNTNKVLLYWPYEHDVSKINEMIFQLYVLINNQDKINDFPHFENSVRVLYGYLYSNSDTEYYYNIHRDQPVWYIIQPWVENKWVEHNSSGGSLYDRLMDTVMKGGGHHDMNMDYLEDDIERTINLSNEAYNYIEHLETINKKYVSRLNSLVQEYILLQIEHNELKKSCTEINEEHQYIENDIYNDYNELEQILPANIILLK